MSNVTDASDPLADVSSFYGPGTWAGWACTVLSVIINWTFNAEASRADTLTYDFLAMLAVPMTAAVHFVILLDKSARSDTSPSDREGLGASEPDAVSMAAPFVTCAAFVVVVPYPVFLSTRMCHPKRLAVCLSVALVAYFTQFLTFLAFLLGHLLQGSQHMGARYFMALGELGLSRALFPSAMLTNVLLGPPILIQTLMIPAVWRHWTRRPRGIKRAGAAELEEWGEVRTRLACGEHSGPKKRYKSCRACRAEARAVRWAVRERRLFSGWLAACVALPLHLLYLFCLALLSRTPPRYYDFVVIPQSANLITELDQAAALALGVVTVLCTVRDSIESRRVVGRGEFDERSRARWVAEEVLQQYDASEIELMRCSGFGCRHHPRECASLGPSIVSL